MCECRVCVPRQVKVPTIVLLYNIIIYIILQCTGKNLIFKTPVAAGLLVESFRIKSALPRERILFRSSVPRRFRKSFLSVRTSPAEAAAAAATAAVAHSCSDNTTVVAAASAFAKRPTGRRIFFSFARVEPLSPPPIPPRRNNNVVPVFGMTGPIILRAPKTRRTLLL